MTEVLLTGVTGAVGSCIAEEWLNRTDEGRLICLARGSSDAEARQRVGRAIQAAAWAAGRAVPRHQGRVAVIRADLQEAGWQSAVCDVVDPGRDLRIVHSAAELSFSTGQADSVWAVNHGGTGRLLELAERLPGLVSFNHISTAYVSGGRQGIIAEPFDSSTRPYNNAYEASKHEAERAVIAFGQRTGIPIRIFAPSIVVGHSRTGRTVSDAGLYRVVDRVGRIAPYLPRRRIRTVADGSAPLDLIPIDVVVAEVLDLLDDGTTQPIRRHHLTNQQPLTVGEVFAALSPLVDVDLVAAGDGARSDRDPAAALVRRAMRHYMPYMTQHRHYDRTSVASSAAGGHQRRHRLSVDDITWMASTYLESGVGGAAADSSVLSASAQGA